jgi:hypothetical protein
MITKISMRRKASILGLLFLAAFLVPLGARAVAPSPLTTVVNVSTVGNQPGVCTSTSGAAVQALSDVFSIPSGHSAYILPPVLTGLFSASSTSNPIYFISWFANSTQLGFQASYAQPGGLTTEGGFGQEIMNSAALSFFNTAHAGPVTYNFIIDISSTSGQVACVQQPYLSLAIVET